MSTAGRIAKNTAALAAGNLITKFLSLAFFVYVARRLGDVSFGRFSTAMALVGLVEVIPGYLSRPYLIREIARAPERARDVLAQVTVVNTALALAVFAGLSLAAPHFGYHPDTVMAIALLAFALVFDANVNSYHATLAGFERMELSALLNIVNTLLTVALGGAVLWSHGGLIPLILAYVAAKALTLLVGAGLLARLRAHPSLAVNRARLTALLRGAWPFFITTVFVMLYARLDIVMLSFFRGEEEVGYYNAAYKVMEGLGLITASFVAAVYPVLARQFVDRPDRVVATYRRAFRFLVAFVLPAAAGLALVANDLIPALFGATFVPAATALAILVWGQALDSLNPLLTQTLRATDRERSAAAITGIGAAVNLALNVALIPPFGLYGAAVATVLSFAVLLAINLRVLHNAVGPAHLGDALTRSGAATAVMAAALWGLSRYALAGWSAGSRLAVLIAAGAVLYPLLAWVCGVLDAEDRALLGGLVRRRLGRAKGAA